MKKVLFTFLFLIPTIYFAQNNTSVTKTKSRSARKDSLSARRLRLVYDFKTIGLDVALPSFRNDMVLSGYMFGPTVQYFGFMELGGLRGTTYKKSNPLLTQEASTFYIGFKYNHILLVKRALNFGPSFGLRFMLNELKDPLFDENAAGNSGTFGMGLHAGAFIKIGPVFLSAKMHVDGNINFNKGSSFNPLSIYPTFGIAFSPMEVLMNPKEFSHTAMAHWTTDYKSTVSKSIEYKGADAYEVTRYSATWKDNYGNRTMSCKDVQPFFFIGPRISTNITHFNKTNLLSAYGANVGVRRGSLFLNGFFEKANIHFKDEINRSFDTTQIKNGSFKGRIDGEFVNSTKYGAQIGVECINWFQSADFIYKESRVKRATAFTSIIFFAGLGKAKLGDLKFNSDSGLVSYTNHIAKDPTALSDETKNILLTKKDKSFLSFGLQFGFGAIALNTEFSLYDKANKSLNNWNVGLSYNMPIIRIFRALRAANYTRKINKLKNK